ncbi:MAG: mitochondrial small ribosomal subunit protein uS17m [Candidatus Doudnabacteria bacterium]|nr:mitochondrial small ribosomal subunit protein uS17m [Candidatus Doudnabacteria bacterium]
MTDNQVPRETQSFIAEVVGRSGSKTAVVKLTVVKQHRKYHKRYSQQKKYLVHDEREEAKPGDRVLIVPGRPLSRRKRFRIAEKLN